MTLGEKIRKYRLLHDMTQKELGIKVGFSAATADSRIRKYEGDIMAPKSDIRNRLVQALDVDPSALSNIAIQSDEDVMQVLFYFSEILDMDIERTDGKFYLSFPVNQDNREQLISYLNVWVNKKKNLRNTANSTSEKSIREYELWKSKFPKIIEEEI